MKNISNMETIRIDILNPKAKKLLIGLADLNLIKISKTENNSDFSTLLKKLRNKNNDEITLEEITKEVEEVRQSRYEK
jgi:glycerol-3-phosphate dehydrogenase